MASAWPAIDSMLAQVSGALSLIGQGSAVEQVRELRDMIAALAAQDADADHAASTATLATRFAVLVQQVAALSWQPEAAEDRSTAPFELIELIAPTVLTTAPTDLEEPPVDDLLPDFNVPTSFEIADHRFTLSPPLHAIYLKEAHGLLAQITDSIQQWCAAPQTQFLQTATHALHSLVGSSATVGLQAIQELAAALEILLEEFSVAGATPSLSDCALSLEAGTALENMLAQLLAHQLPSPQSALAQELLKLSQQRRVEAMPVTAVEVHKEVDEEAAAEVQESAVFSEPVEILALPLTVIEPVPDLSPELTPELRSEPIADLIPAAVNNQADPELLSIFIEEATDLLFQVEQKLRAWQAEPAATSPAPALLRILHTLKGSARMAGAAALGDQLHQMENALSQAEPTGPAQIGNLLAGLDGAMHLFAELMPPAQSAPVADTRSRSEPPRVQQLQLRVRADLLDRVASSAAELVVGSARVNGELQQQRHALADLNDNLGRLRSQLREVEIQAETQIASSVAQSATREFDPLEFDRFTSLQELTRMMAETVADVVSVQRMLSRHVDSAALAMTAQLRHARTLQDDFRRVRIVQFSSIAERLYLLVRQVAHELERQVRLELQGGSVELDRSMLDKLGAPLEHLLRNAIAHGIELPAQRLAAGKPAEGVVLITLAQQGNDIVLQISDDGRGLDSVRIRTQAISAGLIAADAQLTDAEIAALIFEPGLSTAEEVTTVAGRGIGMDAVRADLLAQGGSIKVDSAGGSKSGSGTCFTLVLPLTLATTQVVLASAGGMQIALPSALVQQVLQLPAAQLQLARAAGSLTWRGEQLPLHNLGSLMGNEAADSMGEQLVPVVILRQLNGLLAIELEAIAGNREVVVKNIGPQLSQLAGLAGATVLADASIVLIINPLPLVEAAERRQRAGMRMPAAVTIAQAETALPLVLVVDDSLTVRRVSQRLLEKHGYATLLARDGLDALDKLAAVNAITPAVMLFDIEMPRMDGFDLLRHVRQDARLSATPVVMITSRTAGRHREHAMALGATAYLGKPFQETELLALLTQLCAKPIETEA
jgi:chemosensory pili system protein ChpA (sensor histidine kinase/response regulator)